MDTLALGLEHILTLPTLAAIVVGTVLGVVVGVLPGLGSVIGITMVLPFTFTMPQIPALALMLGIYCGSVYGGSISAIVINTPGTPQAAATIARSSLRRGWKRPGVSTKTIWALACMAMPRMRVRVV